MEMDINIDKGHNEISLVNGNDEAVKLRNIEG